ncbi:Hypothetical protein D9617_5g070280 [Elsinoe fawcettii]|nr:Hypothetical protein D9617_5g070280 [Elsinoe fawcettii]
MSTASEQRAWRGGNRPASIARAPIPQSRSSATSPTASGASTPNPALPRQTESKPLATVKPAEQTKATPAPAPAGNIWETRKQAQQARTTASGTVTPKESTVSGTDGGKKIESVAAGKEEARTSVNNFNTTEVKDFLRRDAAGFKIYRIAESNPKPASAVARGNISNGQSFFSSLSKQIAQLQGNK